MRGGSAEFLLAAGPVALAPLKVTDCAWVTLVMRGDAYVGGAITMAFSMRRAGTEAALVCMVTDDVSEGGRAILREVFDEVVRVPNLSYKCKPLKTEKQRKMYEEWMADGFTKWACLSLTRYRRICFVDADKVALVSCDDIFGLPAPAGTFSSPWAEPFAGRGMYNPYRRGGLLHGAAVPAAAIEEGFTRNSFVAIATMLLLEPDAGLFEEFKTFCEVRQPFGYPGCYSMMDEQAIVRFYYERGVPWHFIHQSYNYIPWQRAWLPLVGAGAAGAAHPIDPTLPKVFHYFGKKVWGTPRSEWPDAEVWWRFAVACARAHPKTAGAFDAKLLAAPAPAAPACAWCLTDPANVRHAELARGPAGRAAVPAAAAHDLIDETGRNVCVKFAPLVHI